jgi:uncharacterized membrane protein
MGSQLSSFYNCKYILASTTNINRKRRVGIPFWYNCKYILASTTNINRKGRVGIQNGISTLSFPLIFVVFAKIYLQLYQNGIPTLLFLLIFVVFAKIYLQLYQNGIPTLLYINRKGRVGIPFWYNCKYILANTTNINRKRRVEIPFLSIDICSVC